MRICRKNEGNSMNLPKDPVMLLSVVNTQLRDQFSSLEELASAYSVEASAIEQRIAAIDYHYDQKTNQFR